MTLIVETPDVRSAAWTYILNVVLRDWLGLEFRHCPANRGDVSIRMSGSQKELLASADFLSIPPSLWLDLGSLPELPLRTCDLSGFIVGASSETANTPIIFGRTDGSIRISEDRLDLPLDIFGSAFFFLTRYEELVRAERDRHDRFPASASIAYKAALLERPIVDEYCEILWRAIKHLWPSLKRRTHHFQTIVSHDVDAAGKYSMVSFASGLRASIADLVKRRHLSAALSGLQISLFNRHTLDPADPFNTFEWLMDMSERNGLSSAFYFICGRTDPLRDAAYEPENDSIRRLLRSIAQRGHEVGLHPSYNTYRDPNAIQNEAERLRKICHEEGIRQEQMGGRMHYLRWDQKVTPAAWEAAGMNYDSTLGFADRVGFRCGTSREFQAFDLEKDRSLELNIRPLVAMERSVMDSQYMGLGNGAAAFDAFVRLKAVIRRYNGNFTLLWHNSSLNSAEDRELYQQVLVA